MRDGMFIEIWYERSSASFDLLDAADGRTLLDLYTFFRYVERWFVDAHPLPKHWQSSEPRAKTPLLERTGASAGLPVELYRSDGGYTIRRPTRVGGDGFHYMAHTDAELLERVFAATVGEVSWAEAPVASRV